MKKNNEKFIAEEISSAKSKRFEILSQIEKINYELKAHNLKNKNKNYSCNCHPDEMTYCGCPTFKSIQEDFLMDLKNLEEELVSY